MKSPPVLQTVNRWAFLQNLKDKMTQNHKDKKGIYKGLWAKRSLPPISNLHTCPTSNEFLVFKCVFFFLHRGWKAIHIVWPPISIFHAKQHTFEMIHISTLKILLFFSWIQWYFTAWKSPYLFNQPPGELTSLTAANGLKRSSVIQKLSRVWIKRSSKSRFIEVKLLAKGYENFLHPKLECQGCLGGSVT